MSLNRTKIEVREGLSESERNLGFQAKIWHLEQQSGFFFGGLRDSVHRHGVLMERYLRHLFKWGQGQQA